MMKRTMTRKEVTPRLREIKKLMAAEADFMRPMIGKVVQEVLEAEMREALGAEKGERTESRVGYRSWRSLNQQQRNEKKLPAEIPILDAGLQPPFSKQPLTKKLP